jgi:hypothetical protein
VPERTWLRDEEAINRAEFFTPAHAALLAKILARIDRLTAGIQDLSQVIEQVGAGPRSRPQGTQPGSWWGQPT